MLFKLSYVHLLMTIVILPMLIQMNDQSEMATCGLLSPALIPLMTNSFYTHRWPWHAAIYHLSNKMDPIYKCGGTVVSSNSVLTAAHCVSKSGVRMKNEEIAVWLGKLTLSENESSAQSFQVSEIIIYPNFDADSLSNDIAIVKLSANATFNRYVYPVCLWKSHKIDLSEVIGTSVCYGDSGGSMTFEENGIFYIRGIVSSTPAKLNSTTQKSDCDSMEYAIFTDVARYLPWIRERSMIDMCETKVRCEIGKETDVCSIVLSGEYSAQKCKIIFDTIQNGDVTKILIEGGADELPDLSDAVEKFENLNSLNLRCGNLKVAERARLAAFSKINILDLSKALLNRTN